MEAIKLEPIYSSQKSFYGKAETVQINEEKTLISYETNILSLVSHESIRAIHCRGYSQTTMKHINEFLLQNGFPTLNKKGWEKLISWFDENEGPLLRVDFDDELNEQSEEETLERPALLRE